MGGLTRREAEELLSQLDDSALQLVEAVIELEWRRLAEVSTSADPVEDPPVSAQEQESGPSG